MCWYSAVPQVVRGAWPTVVERTFWAYAAAAPTTAMAITAMAAASSRATRSCARAGQRPSHAGAGLLADDVVEDDLERPGLEQVGGARREHRGEGGDQLPPVGAQYLRPAQVAPRSRVIRARGAIRALVRGDDGQETHTSILAGRTGQSCQGSPDCGQASRGTDYRTGWAINSSGAARDTTLILLSRRPIAPSVQGVRHI